MTITTCPKCGSMNITTAGTCANCGWSQFAQVTVSSGVYNTIGEIEIMLSGKALLDDYKRLLLENRNLKERVAELESAQRWIPVSEGTKGLEILEDYLTTDESGEIYKMKYCGVLRGVQKWLWSDNAFYHPTHWMPLPELPEVK